MDSKSKTPKYWYQSTGCGMRNDWTIRPASGLKRKPWALLATWVIVDLKMQDTQQIKNLQDMKNLVEILIFQIFRSDEMGR